MGISLGSRVKDSITGFQGIAIAVTEWLYGCRRFGVEPEELKDGKPVETQWFDEQRLEIMTEQGAPARKDDSANPGGPQKDPQRTKNPR